MSHTDCLYFDESGQTYYNYLDPNQAYLAYGGLFCNEDEAQKLKAQYFGRVQAEELHYVQLRKTGVGQASIKSFLDSEQGFRNEAFKWFLVDKRYALLAKYVDLMIEPEVADLGDNLYANGGAQELCFLLHHIAHLKGRQDSLSQLMTAFSEYARKPDLESLASLERIAVSADVGDEKMNLLLRMPFIRSGTKLLQSAEPEHLDLCFTAAWTLLEHWYKELDRPVHLIHDESSALSSQREAWRNMTDPGAGFKQTMIGATPVPLNIPLLETVFVSSGQSAALQMVDVLVGAGRSLFEWRLKGKPENRFLEEMDAIVGEWLPTWSILPLNDPMDSARGDQSVDELNKALDEISRQRGEW